MTFTTSDLQGLKRSILFKDISHIPMGQWRKCLKYVGNIQDHVVCNE